MEVFSMAQNNKTFDKKSNTNAPFDTSFGYLGSLYQRYIRNQKKITALVITGALTMSFATGCNKATTDSSTSDSPTTATTSDANATSNGSVSTVSFTKSDMFTDRDSNPSYDEKAASTITFSESGVSSSSDSVTISDSSTVSNNATDSDTNDTTASSCTTVTISEAGTYILSGSASNAQVIIDADKETKIQLVLDDLTLNCESSAPIYVRKADKVFITLADGSSNTLSTTGEFVTIDDNNIDAVIFSKDDLTLNGSGSLTINAPYGHGIVSKDDLVVTGGTYTMTCAKHGLSGKDSVRILDGTFDLTVTKDGIHASNDDDENLGYIYIAGGTFTINSDDDGMHADSTLYIEDGTIDIQKSYEGLEGQTITILDGDIDIVSSDDGINAANGSGSNDSIDDKQGKGGPGNGQMPGNPPSGDNQTPKDPPSGDNQMPDTPPSNDNFDPSNNSNNNMDQPQGNTPGGMGGFDMDADESCVLTINDGTITINAGGDGIDSNGYFYINGGTVYVEGPESNGNSALDYGISATITGGYFLSTGYSGMAQSFSSDSTQCSYMLTLSSNTSGTTTVTLTDADGKVLLSHETSKSYNSIIVSCPELEVGSTYTLTAGDTSQSITPTSTVN
ncbi:carbohydrate-binding domain-containing protein [Clostridium sp. OF10-22XD]|nr:carbohydrate-binding domain-containing protein [Clostridium sp. OF10-22XD]